MFANTAKKSYTSPVGEHFISSMENVTLVTYPYNYWLLENSLPERTINDLFNLPFPAPSKAIFDGSREVNNSTRVYFNPENQARYPVCRDVAEAFSDPAVIKCLEQATGADFSDAHLRVEYCQDIEGFWLEPHPDISVKLFSMLIYLSPDPNLADAGTDVYDDTPEHNLVKSTGYARNKSMFFVPAKNTWHGFTKRPINGLRKSIIINYVTSDWRNTEELA